jgi:hypothetical protein
MSARTRSRALSLSTALLPILLAACPADPPAEDGSLVVGLQTDDFGGLVGSVRVVVEKEGEVVHDEVLQTSAAGASVPTLPKEFLLVGRPGARIDVTAQAFPAAGGPPLVTRDASARLVTGVKKLLRVQLESRCLQLPPAGGAPAAGVSCAAPLTCVAGACAPREVEEGALEDYEPGWAAAPPDICRPAQHGPPQVIIGTGQTAYADLGEGQLLQLEKGPQGGHHLWIAARMKNLRQSGSTTAITSRLLDDPEAVPPVAFVFTYERDEGAYCAVWGLRYQIDAGAADLRQAYRRFLGKKLEVTVEVRDTTGASARDTRTVQIADKLLCPDGTDACNTP